MSTKIISLSVPIPLLTIIDDQAKHAYETRSEYIKNTLVERLKRENVLRPEESIGILGLNEARREQLKRFLKTQQIDEDELS
jgi:metal-responsive CopG/Arc/MetJ family transcriptional regulator